MISLSKKSHIKIVQFENRMNCLICIWSCTWGQQIELDFLPTSSRSLLNWELQLSNSCKDVTAFQPFLENGLHLISIIGFPNINLRNYLVTNFFILSRMVGDPLWEWEWVWIFNSGGIWRVGVFLIPIMHV